MSAQPEICILKTDGINCDEEMRHAFEVAGGSAEIVHVNEIRSGSKRLADYAGIGLPGGFSYGDDIASGAVLANELTQFLGEELQAVVDDEKPILGVCNGFQVLTRTGLLPAGHMGERRASLRQNNVGHFVCKWVELTMPDNACRFLDPQYMSRIYMQIAHGEGRFTTGYDTLFDMYKKAQIAFQYRDNPNGSVDGIAGITNPAGTVLGMMPHPERSVEAMHPDRSKTAEARQAAQMIFSGFVNYAKEL